MSYLRTINRELKFFDRKLYADKTADGKVQIFREGVQWDSIPFENSVLWYSRPQPYYILSLTHNWAQQGKPVEWGLEPLLMRLREIDDHRIDVLGKIHEENEKRAQLARRSKHNEYKAAAADSRRDFARAVNDINTSTLNKVDSRRKKDANCR